MAHLRPLDCFRNRPSTTRDLALLPPSLRFPLLRTVGRTVLVHHFAEEREFRLSALVVFLLGWQVVELLGGGCVWGGGGISAGDDTVVASSVSGFVHQTV